MATGVQEYDFIPPKDGDDYNIFPDMLENDANVFFHGTTASSRAPIIANGFKPKAPLETTTLTRKSKDALAYACKKFPDVDRCVLAVRVDDVTAPGINSREPFGIYIHMKGPPPTVIGFCLIPASYMFR